MADALINNWRTILVKALVTAVQAASGYIVATGLDDIDPKALVSAAVGAGLSVIYNATSIRRDDKKIETALRAELNGRNA